MVLRRFSGIDGFFSPFVIYEVLPNWLFFLCVRNLKSIITRVMLSHPWVSHVKIGVFVLNCF